MDKSALSTSTPILFDALPLEVLERIFGHLFRHSSSLHSLFHASPASRSAVIAIIINNQHRAWKYLDWIPQILPFIHHRLQYAEIKHLFEGYHLLHSVPSLKILVTNGLLHQLRISGVLPATGGAESSDTNSDVEEEKTSRSLRIEWPSTSGLHQENSWPLNSKFSYRNHIIMASEMPGVEELYIDCDGVDITDLFTILPRFQALKQLTLSKARVKQLSDISESNLNFLRQLDSLAVRNSFWLEDLQRLFPSLMVETCNVIRNSYSIQLLSRFTKLQRVSLYICSAEIQKLPVVLGALPNLHSLKLHFRSRMTVQGNGGVLKGLMLDTLNVLPNLQSLELFIRGLSTADYMAILGQKTELRTLVVLIDCFGAAALSTIEAILSKLRKSCMMLRDATFNVYPECASSLLTPRDAFFDVEKIRSQCKSCQILIDQLKRRVPLGDFEQPRKIVDSFLDTIEMIE